jgi:poly-D-alanine transfer protein DltD
MADSPISALRFLLIEAITIGVAISAAVFAFQWMPKAPVEVPPKEVSLPAGKLLSRPSDTPILSRVALEDTLRRGDLVLFGSSELGTNETSIQNLYPSACGKRVLALGHAGFQSLPILLALAEARQSLSPQSNIVIILSPVWFTERGTPSGAFLQVVVPHRISELLREKDLPDTVRSALALEIRTHRDELTGLYPDYLYTIFPALTRWTSARAPDLSGVRVTAEPAVATPGFNWDETENKWKEVLRLKSEGNPIGTTAEYYNRIKKYNPPYPPSKLEPWRIEKRQLYDLSAFLRSYGVHAHFILQPTHRRVYGPLDSYDRLFAEIEERLKADGHYWKSYFTEPYDLTLLRDAAHFSASAWVRVQREICRQ